MNKSALVQIEPPAEKRNPSEELLIELEKATFEERLKKEGSILLLSTLALSLTFLMQTLEELKMWIRIPCLFKKATGLPCLTCGLTRSLSCTSHGDISGSLKIHLLGPFVFVGICLLGFYSLAALVFGYRLRVKIPPKLRDAAAHMAMSIALPAWAMKVIFFKEYW
ncbi:MAG: DUF2752 domain-containing protein [Actinomycetota bacterium]|nr:DUF2752 domain-containing protein [Actinomycetota bacterium]